MRRRSAPAATVSMFMTVVRGVGHARFAQDWSRRGFGERSGTFAALRRRPAGSARRYGRELRAIHVCDHGQLHAGGEVAASSASSPATVYLAAAAELPARPG